MPVAYPEIRKFLGLYLQANSLDLPDGAMEKALDVVIANDNTIGKAKGFYQYYSGGGLTLNALTTYQSTLLAAFSDRLSYFTDAGAEPNLTGTKTDLTGETFAITAPAIVRFLEQSGNLYATTDNGVLKLDAYNASKIFKAGSPPGLDMRGTFDRANGVINGNAEVAYRVLFGRRDANANLILGAPSDILVLTNATVSAVSFTNPTGNQVEVTVSAGHLLTTGMTIQITAATGDVALIGTTQTVISTSLTATVFRFDKGSAIAAPGTITYTVTRAPKLEFSVPREISAVGDAWFYRVFRSSQSSSDAATPAVDFRQIDEQALTAGQISAGAVFYNDVVSDVLLTNATYLYTNPNTGQGESQANIRPPKCDDMTLFQGYSFYARATTRHTIEVDVIDPTVLSSGDKFKTTIDAATRIYTARTGVGNGTVSSESASKSGTTITVTYTSHGLVVSDTILVSNAKGTGTLPSGVYTVATVADVNTLTFTAGVSPTTLTNLDFQGVQNAAGEYLFQLDTSSSAATRLRNTARGLIKAINRDTAAVIYGNYISSIVDTPGKMRLTAAGFGGAIYPFVTAGGAGFSPVLPATASTIFSTNQVQKNAVYVSKLQEPEAAPLANVLSIGSKNKEIIRVIALRNSVIVLKEDGVFKVTGDSPNNFTSVPIDKTALIVSGNSAALANNTVYFLANQGVCAATDSSVQIVSRKIERVIEPIVGKTAISSATAGVGFDSGRTFRISTIGVNDTTTTVTWVYNFLNDTWTESSVLIKGGVIGPNDKLYVAATDNSIQKQRKSQDRTDFCGQNYAITVVSVASDKLSAVVTISGHTPVAGDVIIASNVINHVDAVATSGSNYALTFSAAVNFVAGAAILYAAYNSKVVMAPFHGGAIGRAKQFGQVQLHTRDNGVYRLSIYFINTYFGGSEITSWTRNSVSGSSGWGGAPWGLFGWGLGDGINITFDTEPAPPIRLYVPKFAARATFIKTVFEHMEAGDPINIQAMTFAVRSYDERVDK